MQSIGCRLSSVLIKVSVSQSMRLSLRLPRNTQAFWFPADLTVSTLFSTLGCNITATGCDRQNKKVASQIFPFVANGTAKRNMTLGLFDSSFYNVYGVTFTVTNNATTAALIDDFYANLYEQPAATVYWALCESILLRKKDVAGCCRQFSPGKMHMTI